MNRNDWAVVGMRLYGLYLVVNAILGVMDVVTVLRLAPTQSAVSQAVKVGLMALIGLTLFLGAPGVMKWLQGKDDEFARTGRPT